MVAGLDPVLRLGPLVFVGDLAAPHLDGSDEHHLRRSLRLTAGAAVCVGDGSGSWRTARLGPPGELLLEDLGPLQRDAVASPVVTVGFAAPKGARLEMAVAKLTELGVDRIVILEAERSVVRWPSGEGPRRLERLARVVRESAMQSRRPRLPELSGPLTLTDLIAEGDPAPVLAEPGGPGVTLAHPTVLIGPEGGWSPSELERCAGRVGLGPTVLRVETAAIAAGVALCAQRAGWLG